MKKLFKKITINSIINNVSINICKCSNHSAEILENENLVKLEYTIDEIKAMSLG
ncbi:MAG: hypothetical protein KH415_21990 [Clostridium sp.]|nr:hypothetical protein [Clostridium sp.]